MSNINFWLRKGYGFSSSKIYDIICIGPYACKVGKKVHSILINQRLKSYFVNDSVSHFEPILMQSHRNPFVSTVFQMLPQGCDRGTGVKLIDGQNSRVYMQNGEILHYRQLIYSGNPQEWKNVDYYENLRKGLTTPYTAVYGDEYCKNVHELYLRNQGQILISIPKGRHFGYENYFMLHLQNSLKQNALYKKIPFSHKITILLEGQTFFPYSLSHDQILKKLITNSGIQLITNASISSIDVYKRRAKINNSYVKYQSLYQYLPLKIPSLLQSSHIDPMNIDEKSLRNKKYPNINIVGNNLPTCHSYYGLNYQNSIMAQNISYSLLGLNKMSVYEGNSMMPLWITQKKLIYLCMNYKSQVKQNKWAKKQWVRNLFGFERKLLGKIEIQKYLNGNSEGFPRYFFKLNNESVKMANQLKS